MAIVRRIFINCWILLLAPCASVVAQDREIEELSGEAEELEWQLGQLQGEVQAVQEELADVRHFTRTPPGTAISR